MDARALFKPSLNWLAVFIPATFLLAYVPAWHNEALLFVCAGQAMVIVSAWIASHTEPVQ